MTCLNCNNIIFNRHNKKFCSRDCFKKWLLINNKNKADNHVSWGGDSVTYSTKHRWVRTHYGRANKCENKDCVTPYITHFEWANISGEYKRMDRSDWKMMCSSCHRKYDYGNYCSKGHEFTYENTRININGWRICKICDAERARNRRLRKDDKCNQI